MSDLGEKLFYLRPENIRFLMTEVLALKLYLHDHGQLDPEKYKEYVARAAATLEQSAQPGIERLRQVAETETVQRAIEAINRETLRPTSDAGAESSP